MEEGREGMRKDRGIALLVLILSLVLCVAVGGAQEKKKVRKETEKKSQTDGGFGLTATRGPIDITSDSVEYDQKQNSITFKGNVVAKQEDSTLYANTMVVHHDPESKKLKTIVATGNVKIVQLERRATGHRATFDQDENKIILEGDAVVREGDNVVRGERVIYYMNEERSVVEGGKAGRVMTTITPSKKE
jgi:lipopolysaccharide export system protein LptA